MRQQGVTMQRQTEAAEEALNASVRPLVVDVPRRTTQTVALSFHEQMRCRNRPEESPGRREIDASRIVSSEDVEESEPPFLTVPIRNVGPGVALVVAARLAVASQDLRNVLSANGEMTNVIAPGEIVRVTFQHHEPQPGWLLQRMRSDEALVVEIAYTDVSGRQPTASRLSLARVKDDPDRSYSVPQTYPFVERLLTASVQA